GRLFPPRPSDGGAAARRRARAEQLAAPRTLPERRGVSRKRFSRPTVSSVALRAVGALGLVQVLPARRIATGGYDVRALEVERQSLSSEIRVLETQIAASTNLEHLRSEAIERLGMVPANERIRINVDVPAPNSVPLPRRYVPDQEHDAPEAPA